MQKKRKKSWEQKVELVSHSFLRTSKDEYFARNFYENLFFLNPKIADYFKHTDFAHQDKALMHGLHFLLGFLDGTDDNARKQVLRLARSHAKSSLNIHPHHYYYWIEALIITTKNLDPEWYDDLEYYWREVIHFPVTFMISQYYTPAENS